ncbi:MAG: DNA adenine methylase [Novosphingobium sp.]|nr:DNA adenine methylase [Novosphingobium sp.]
MKYMGGKSKIVNEILPIILDEKDKYHAYIEPFCGSLAVIERVEGIRKVASDVNPYLIALWKGLKFGMEKPMEIPKPLYDIYRNKFNSYKKQFVYVDNNNNSLSLQEFVNNCVDYNSDLFKEIYLIGWIGFMGSYNGRFYDGGYSGKTDKRDYIDEQIRNTLKQVDYLYNIEFRCFSYDILFDKILLDKSDKRFIIYNDIPYKDTKQYEYSKLFDYDKFYNYCELLSAKGHKLFISEYNMTDKFKCVWEKQVTNSLNTKNTYKPIEKLFTI